MFDLIIKEAASRFGLGDKAGPLVQMLVAYMTNKDTGGLSGFINMFKNKGLGDVAGSWLGGNASAQAINGTQIENVLGGKGGFLEAALSKTGLSSGVATSALGYLMPSILGKLTPGGSVPTSLPQEVMGFAEQGKGLFGGLLGSGAAAATGAASAVGAVGNMASGALNTASAGGGGMMKWLWLIVPIAIGLWALKSCGGVEEAAKKAADAAKATASATADAAKATADSAKSAADAAKATASSATDAAANAAKGATDAAQGAATGAIDAAKGAATGAVDAAKGAATGALDAAKGAAASGAAAVAGAMDKLPGLVDGAPSTKLYFDSGKVNLPADANDKLKPIIEYLKANAGTKAALSGYHDPTGDLAQNQELAKNRAKMVRESLRAAGLTDDQILTAKPEQTAATVSLQEARRVEVSVRK
jgi:uncharacterized protein YidB (DUF937 family)/outer membrane protein OmpA-like peptidoglycan-associated protein